MPCHRSTYVALAVALLDLSVFASVARAGDTEAADCDLAAKAMDEKAITPITEAVKPLATPPARIVSGKKVGPFLARKPKYRAIAVDGVDFNEEVIKAKMLPRGSAMLTGSGALAKTGIKAVIHAASGSMTKAGDAFDPSLKGLHDSVRNSFILARRHGYKRVAVPFIGGGIFAGAIGLTQEELARELVRAAIRDRGKLQVVFVPYGEKDAALFNETVAAETKGLPAGAVTVAPGSITDFKVHKAPAIVNAANMEVQFGGGVSGVIGRATGQAAKIDRAAAMLIAGLDREVTAKFFPAAKAKKAPAKRRR